MPTARHILIVNSRSVHQPVFVVGAPHSGAELIGRALKASPGFHLTIGQPSVLRTVYAFARRPSMHHGRTQAAATVNTMRTFIGCTTLAESRARSATRSRRRS